MIPKPKLFSSSPLLHPGGLLPVSFSRFTLAIYGAKPVRSSLISTRRQRECGVTSASRWRCLTASISDASILDDKGVDETEEEEEDFVPLREMTRWLQNKPAGFGEGRTYDTEVEDKILEDLDRSRKNQLEEKRKTRENSMDNAGSAKKQVKQNVTDAIKSDTEVRVGNLPKKKNIDRDLWKAFKGFPGITTISPAVTGNKKTRDPICRGFAIVGFDSNDAANRFVQKFSKQNLDFGKTQKQISCDILNGNSALKSPDSSDWATSLDRSEQRNENSMAEQNREAYIGRPPNDRTISLSANVITEVSMAFENSGTSSSGFVEGEYEQVSKDPQPNSPDHHYQTQNKIAVKKAKPTKSSKPRVLGSLARLKAKERAVLTGVFSKYGEVDSSASKKS